MKTIGTPPTWAVELMEQVCKDNTRKLPGEFRWVDNSDSKGTSGWTRPDRTKTGRPLVHYNLNKSGKFKARTEKGIIKIKAGSNVDDQRIVLLHEIAHWIAMRKRAESHTVRFWKIAWRLYHEYGANIKEAIRIEGNYKDFAIVVYDREYGNREEVQRWGE